MNDFYINLAVTVMLQAVKDGAIKGKFRRAFLKVFKAVATAYQTDQEFQDAASSIVKREEFK